MYLCERRSGLTEIESIGGLVHTVQINYDKKSDQYIIVQMFSTMNQPNAKGAKENLQKIINKR